MHGKRMTEALNEVRSFRDTTEGGPGSGPQKGGKKFSSSEIKKAYGILNDPRYKQGNYTGAAKAINKLAPGLADHPDVKNAMKRANEELEEANRYSVALKGDAKKLFDLSWKAGSKSKAYGDKEWNAAVDDTAKKYRDDNHIRVSDKDIAAVKKAIQYNEFDPSTNEELDLSATGDTTTSNASQEVEQVEDLKEYTGMSISKSVNSNDVATALKNLKKGAKLYVQGKPQGGQRTMGDVISVSGDTVKIKPTASNGPTSVNVKDITMMDTLKEDLDEAKFTPAQISAL